MTIHNRMTILPLLLWPIAALEIGCAQDIRGDAYQVYVNDTFAFFDTVSIDKANQHCAQYGKITVYRGQYSGDTRSFACISPPEPPAAPASLSSMSPEIDELRSAAERGDDKAMFKLAVIYSGLQKSSVAPDTAVAMQWFSRSAERGNSNAMLLIGAAYLKGQLGLPSDKGKALVWLTKSASNNNALAMFAIGMMYDDGFGVETDKAAARNWFQLSANFGNADAKKHLAMLPAD